MSDPAVLIAVRDHLAATPGLPAISWPNSVLPTAAPFLIFDNGPTTGRPYTTDGEERFEFRPVVSYMAAFGEYTAAGDAALYAIAQAFKFNTSILAGGIKVGYSLQTPVAEGGFTDGTYFRRTMTLRIASHQKI